MLLSSLEIHFASEVMSSTPSFLSLASTHHSPYEQVFAFFSRLNLARTPNSRDGQRRSFFFDRSSLELQGRRRIRNDGSFLDGSSSTSLRGILSVSKLAILQRTAGQDETGLERTSGGDGQEESSSREGERAQPIPTSFLPPSSSSLRSSPCSPSSRL